MEHEQLSTSSFPIPEQHDDQLQLGFRMIQNAYNSKVHNLDQELRQLKMTCDDQKSQSGALQRKCTLLENELVESHQRSQQLSEENKELFKTVQQLRRQLQRLEGLKKQVMDSLQDEKDHPSHDEDHKLYLRDDYLRSSLPLTAAASGAALHGGGVPLPHAAQPAAPTSRPQSRPTSPPRGPPANSSSSTSMDAEFSGLRGLGVGGVPTGPAASLGPEAGGATPGVDGKQFFRQARNSLSYEAFNEFLANIKKLNAQQQTREETLEEARRIFGVELQHLYTEFEQLLNRQSM